MTQRFVRILFAVMIAGMLTACGSGSDRTRFSVRFIHAVADAFPVDIWVQDRTSQLFGNLTYATATGFQALEPGTYVFEVRPAGAARDDPALASVEVTVEETQTSFTIIIGGLANVPDTDPDALRLDVYQDGFEGDGLATLMRFVHNAAGEPTFDLEVVDDDPLPDIDGSASLTGLERYTASDAAGVRIDSLDPEQLQVFDNGTGDALSSFTTPELDESTRYYAVFLGSLSTSPRDDEGFRILLADSRGGFQIIEQNPRLYFFNSIADSTTVDSTFRFLDELGEPVGLPQELENNILYADLGGDSGISLQLPPGEYEFTFQIPGDLEPIGVDFSGVLLRGQQYLYVIGGRRDRTWPFQLIRAQDLFDRSALGMDTVNRWRILQAAPDIQSVFFGQIMNMMFETLPAFPDPIFYGASTEPTGEDIGLNEFELAVVREADSSEFGLFDIVPVANALEFVVLLGSVEVLGSPPQLSFIDTSVQPWALREQLAR
ncbi:MAG: DUF4397 domain-containing protein [Planctomycetota bacterium]